MKNDPRQGMLCFEEPWTHATTLSKRKVYWPWLKERAEQIPVPERFLFTVLPGHPKMLLTDSTTGRTVRIPIWVYRDVRRILRSLFHE